MRYFYFVCEIHNGNKVSLFIESENMPSHNEVCRKALEVIKMNTDFSERCLVVYFYEFFRKEDFDSFSGRNDGVEMTFG